MKSIFIATIVLSIIAGALVIFSIIFYGYDISKFEHFFGYNFDSLMMEWKKSGWKQWKSAKQKKAAQM